MIETLIAMIILLLAFLAMLSVVPFGFNSVQTNAAHMQAVAIGQRFLDDERVALQVNGAMPTATTVPIDPGLSYVANGHTNPSAGNFSVTPNNCTPVQSSGSILSEVNLYTCSVNVAWTEGGAARSVLVQSYVVYSKP